MVFIVVVESMLNACRCGLVRWSLNSCHRFDAEFSFSLFVRVLTCVDEEV